MKSRTNNGVKTSNATPITALKLHGANHDVHIDDARATWRQSQQTAKKGNASQRTYKVAMIKVDDATRRATQTYKIQRCKTHVLVDDVTIQRRNASTNRRKQSSLPYHNVNHAATSSKNNPTDTNDVVRTQSTFWMTNITCIFNLYGLRRRTKSQDRQLNQKITMKNSTHPPRQLKRIKYLHTRR